MKILQVTCHFRPNVGGVETHLDDLVNALLERNHKVTVLTYKPLTYKTSWKPIEKLHNLMVFRIPWFSGLFYKLIGSPVLEFLYLFPGIFIILPIVVLLTNPEVIHTHGLVAGFCGVFWGRIFNKKVVATTHSMYLFPEKSAYTSFVRWIFSNSNFVLTLSKQSAKEIEKLGVDTNKIKVFRYWVNLDIFKPVKSKIESKKDLNFVSNFTVLFVGRLVAEKGIPELLESLKNFEKDILLVIVGNGPLSDEIKKTERKIKNLKFVGKIENSKLPLFYSAADFLIVPSTHEEGFGRVIIEALACGTPVIGSKRGAIPEAIDESVGKLIEVSPKNISYTINDLYKNPRISAKLASNARSYAQDRYSDKNISTILNCYK